MLHRLSDDDMATLTEMERSGRETALGMVQALGGEDHHVGMVSAVFLAIAIAMVEACTDDEDAIDAWINNHRRA